MEVKVKETRGAEIKYDFSNMEIGEHRQFENTSTGTILNCAKRYSRINNLSWSFRCYTENNYIVIVRVK